MLQWMGGSRRKVTTSRKSTQKRQRQYFEQRKRQQQQQQTTGVESSTDGINACSQHQNNNRSLDILSLLNLSTVVQDRKSSCHSARENSECCAMTVNYPITKRPPTIHTDKVTPGEPIEFNEEGNLPGCQVETVYTKKVLSSAPQSQHTDFVGNGDRTDQLKMASEHQLSVFDLVGDDGPNDNLEGSPMHEAHVAFAVEGLGKVETETPVHSPQQPGRIFSYGFSSPLKAARQPQPSNNLNNLEYDLELEAGAVIQDIDLLLSGSSGKLPFCSSGVANSFSKPRQKLSTGKGCLHFNSNASKLKNSFADDEIFCNIEDNNGDIWNATSNFIDGNFLDEDCDVTRKNKPLKVDGRSADYWNLGNHEMSDFFLEGPCLQKNRVTEEATGRFNFSDSPTLYFKQQRAENDYDFLTPDGTWYPTVGRNCDIRDETSKPAWSCYVTEDAGDSLSLLSEESCSSSAVRGKATKRPPSKSVVRQNIRRHSSDIKSTVNEGCFENIYAKDRHYAQIDSFHEGKKINGPGKFTKMRNPSSSIPAHFSNTLFQEKLGPEDSCLFEEGYISADRDSGFSSFCRSSGAKKGASLGPKLWSEDPFGAYPLPELRANVKSSFERSKPDGLPEFSPSGSFSSEKLAFCQPYSPVHSYETPFFSTMGSRPSKPNLCTDSNVKGKPRDSFPDTGSLEDAEFLSVSVEESVARSEIQPTDLSSEDGHPLEASVFKDNCADCNEGEYITLEMENRKATCSPEHAEEISSAVNIPDKFDGSVDKKEFRNNAHTSLPCQNASIETEDSGRKETKLECNGRNTSLDPSYQVMMLESYVLQLLCVQKVLKDASVQDTVKKTIEWESLLYVGYYPRSEKNVRGNPRNRRVTISLSERGLRRVRGVFKCRACILCICSLCMHTHFFSLKTLSVFLSLYLYIPIYIYLVSQLPNPTFQKPPSPFSTHRPPPSLSLPHFSVADSFQDLKDSCQRNHTRAHINSLSCQCACECRIQDFVSWIRARSVLGLI